jgi:hypothetical protein
MFFKPDELLIKREKLSLSGNTGALKATFAF